MILDPHGTRLPYIMYARMNLIYVMQSGDIGDSFFTIGAVSWIYKWLESMGWRKPTDAGADERDTPVEMTSDEHVVAAASANDTSAEKTSESDHTPTLATLPSLDESMDFGVESTGFDPYNSGSFESSKERSKK